MLELREGESSGKRKRIKAIVAPDEPKRGRPLFYGRN